MHVQYVTDENGKKSAVQISLKQWSELQKGIKKLELLDELKQAFKDIELHQSGKLKTPTTKELLDQL